MKSSRASDVCRAAIAGVLCSLPALAEAAYRLTIPDPQVQSITNIPLAGFDVITPSASVGTARRAAIAFDGAATGSAYALNQATFSPDPTTATVLTLSAGAGAQFRAGDIVRVGRTGELLRVSAISGDQLTVLRAQLDSIASALVDGDMLTIPSRSTSFVCWYFCEQPETDAPATIWELDRRTQSSATFAMSVAHTTGGWRIDAAVHGAAPLSLDLPFDPRGRWLLLSLAHVNEPGADADSLFLTVFDAATATSIVAGPGEFTLGAPASIVPDTATIGDRFANAGSTSRSALGICIPAIVADAVVDGRALASGVTTLGAASVAHQRGLSGHITFNHFESCVWAANYSGGAFGGASNDARAGITDGALHVFDTNRGSFAARHQLGSGATLRGGLVSVDPYTFGESAMRVARPQFENAVASIASPATAQTLADLGGMNASGVVGVKTTHFARALLEGVTFEKLRVGVFGNSRAVYPQSYPLRLSDGRFPGRQIKTNFCDAGILGQAPVYDNGLIVGHIGPVPWCNWSDVNLPTGEYGADCSVELPRCVANADTAPTLVAPSVAMTSLVNSTLGSRFGIFSPTATRVPSVGFPGAESAGSLDNYRGAHASVRLKPGNSARFMVRPEAGLPTSDPLIVTMYLQNHASSSTVRARAVTSLSQGGVETWSESIAVPGLGSASDTPPVASKPIVSVIQPILSTQAQHSRFGSLTVSDTDGGFAGLEVGDMVQLSDSSGMASVYNEAFSVRELTRFPNGLLRISYEWIPRQFPVVGDRVTFIKGSEILKKVQVEIAPVGDGVWRGIEITADTNGDGVLLWGFGFENPARNGLVTVPIGRSGCGSWIQFLRWPTTHIGGGASLLRRILEELRLDTLVITTADQGTPGGRHVSSCEQIIETVRVESPSTETSVFATGPEFVSEDTLDKSDAYQKFSIFAAMQLAAARRNVPMTSFYCDAEMRSSAFGRIESGTDTTESATHPGTVQDMQMYARQIMSLPPAPPVIVPPLQHVCPVQSVTFAISPSTEPGTSFRWELEDPQSPDGYSVLADGPVVRAGAVVATASGSSTNELTLSDFAAWEAAQWPRGGIASVRCVEIRPSLSLTSAPAEIGVCPTDFDCSQGTDGDDVLVFMGLWDTGDIAADVTGDGGVDGDDVIYFFARWDAGC